MLDNFTYTITNPFHTEKEGNIIVIGDPHFKIDNIADMEIFHSEVDVFLSKNKVDFVVVLGDVLHFHERLFTNVLNKAYEFIHMICSHCPVYVLVGNHDYINNSQFLSTNHWMNALKQWDNVYIVDTVIFKEYPFGRFVFSPYVPPSRFEEALDTISAWKTCTTIFAHQEIRGCKMGMMVSEIGDVWNDTFPMLISGHIHDKQRPQPNVFYTGSSMQHAFGESHNKSITHCTYTKGTVQIQSVYLNIPIKNIMYMDISDVKSFDCKTVKPNEKLRITLTSTLEEFKIFKKSKQYKDMTKYGIKITFKLRECKNITQSTLTKSVRFEDVLYDLIGTDIEMLELYKSLYSS